MHTLMFAFATLTSLLSDAEASRAPQHLYTLRLAPVTITCDLDRRICTGTIDAKDFDPRGHICIGNVCAGCTDGGEDPDNSGFYLQCYISVGEAACGVTCTSNDGWHCIDECW